MNNNGDYGKSTWGERGYEFKFKDKETADKAYQRYKKLYDQRQEAFSNSKVTNENPPHSEGALKAWGEYVYATLEQR